MATIEQTAHEVAEAVVDEHGGYHEYPDLRPLALAIAHDAAVRMSQRLGKSIDSERFLEETIGFQTRAVALSEGHIQVVVLAGYAAFFALWSAMASGIPIAAVLLSGAMMTTSVIVFIGWTVAGLIFAKFVTERTLKVYLDGPVDFWPRYQQAEAINLAGRAKLMRYWTPVVAVAAGTALIAAGTLAISSGISFVQKQLTARAVAQTLHGERTPATKQAIPTPSCAKPPAPARP